MIRYYLNNIGFHAIEVFLDIDAGRIDIFTLANYNNDLRTELYSRIKQVKRSLTLGHNNRLEVIDKPYMHYKLHVTSWGHVEAVDGSHVDTVHFKLLEHYSNKPVPINTHPYLGLTL